MIRKALVWFGIGCMVLFSLGCEGERRRVEYLAPGQKIGPPPQTGLKRLIGKSIALINDSTPANKAASPCKSGGLPVLDVDEDWLFLGLGKGDTWVKIAQFNEVVICEDGDQELPSANALAAQRESTAIRGPKNLPDVKELERKWSEKMCACLTEANASNRNVRTREDAREDCVGFSEFEIADFAESRTKARESWGEQADLSPAQEEALKGYGKTLEASCAAGPFKPRI